MKIAILADIHANIVALQTVADHIGQWRPDAVIVAGDVVNRGPRPLGCLRFVQEKQRAKGWSTGHLWSTWARPVCRSTATLAPLTRRYGGSALSGKLRSCDSTTTGRRPNRISSTAAYSRTAARWQD
ncbi:MAG TPA: metallophosphoesterase [Anaerolineales bacterium]|nr:metallophosphoesterase [Anaerolineales bacterium]